MGKEIERFLHRKQRDPATVTQACADDQPTGQWGSCEELTVVLGLAEEDGAGPRVVRRVEIHVQLCDKHTKRNTRRKGRAGDGLINLMTPDLGGWGGG